MFRIKRTVVTLVVVACAVLFTPPALAAPYGTGGYGDCPYQAGCSTAPSGGSSSSGGGTTTRSGNSTATTDDNGNSPGAPSEDTGTALPTSPKSSNQPRKIATLHDDEKSSYERNKRAIFWIGGIAAALVLLWLLIFFIRRRSRSSQTLF